MDIKDLRYFVAVYESKGFARAGVSLHTVQSNVSARIKRLEEGFGARLFERRPHGIAVTEQGETLYAYAQRLIALADEIEHALASSPATGPVASTARRHPARAHTKWRRRNLGART